VQIERNTKGKLQKNRTDPLISFIFAKVKIPFDIAKLFVEKLAYLDIFS